MKILKIALPLLLVVGSVFMSSPAQADGCDYAEAILYGCQQVTIVTDIPEELQADSYAATLEVDGVRRVAECSRLSTIQTLCALEPPPFVQASSTRSPVPSFTG